MEDTRNSLEEGHQKALAEMNTQYKSIRATEEEKLQQQDTVKKMEEELEAELAAKKAELQQQHQQQLDKLNLELKEKLTSLQQNHQQQETKQKEEFANKLEQLKSHLEKVLLTFDIYTILIQHSLSLGQQCAAGRLKK